MSESLQTNTTISHYRIINKLGAGGMGEVYRAHDERLGRDVAIKVLPAEFAKDADRLRRFEQEARATSALNHPNILTIYDIGSHDGEPYIVSELLDGNELRAQLNEGAIAQRKSIDYAQQIASGLAAAHGKAIIHRDLKPENVFITIDGRVKILDFGLAKLQPTKLASGAGSEVATQKAITDPGTVMGTVGYMSPEQVRGQEADHRSDIFSFGVILYEMLRGRRTFTGESAIEVMNAILKEEPEELTETNTKISPAIERIVQRCLEKKPERRFQSTSDLCFAIEALSMPSGSRLDTAAFPTVTERTGKAQWSGNSKLAWMVAVVFLLVALASLPFAISHLRHAPLAEGVAVRFAISAPETVTGLRALEISPDGRNLMFAATVEGKVSLWLRPLGSLTAQPLTGAEDTVGVGFWSPDSRSICFRTADKLKKIELASGRPQTLCSLPNLTGRPGGGAGGAWNRDGIILFADGGVIYRVSAAGGEPTPVLGTDHANPEAHYRWPTFLPDGRHFVCLRVAAQQGDSEIYLASLDGKELTQLLVSDSQALYAPSVDGSGYVLFAQQGTLLAQPFDADNLKLTGEPSVVADQVKGNPNNRRGFYSVSGNGMLVYDPGSTDENQQLAWIDRAGKLLEPVGARGTIQYPRLSPDGKRVAVVRRDPKSETNDVYVIDLERGTSARLTVDPANDGFPIWSPDGSRIVWTSGREGGHRIYQKLASGVGEDELLFKDETGVATYSWSADGRFILYTRGNAGSDLWVLPLDGDRKPFAFLQTPFVEGSARFSPDGRWVAYRSNESGRDEVYVQTFPASGGKWLVSPNGGHAPQWRGDGKELFYIAGDKKVMAVEVTLGSGFELGVPKLLFDLAPTRAALVNISFAVTSDGQRFLFVRQGEESASLQYTVVVNWTAELKR